MYYITVGKRGTRIVLARITDCLAVANVLNKKFGENSVQHWPRIWTTELKETRPRQERYNAVRILDLARKHNLKF